MATKNRHEKGFVELHGCFLVQMYGKTDITFPIFLAINETNVTVYSYKNRIKNYLPCQMHITHI